MREREEGDTGEGHVGDAAVLGAAGAGLALVARFLAGLDQLLGPHGHEPVWVGEEDGGVAVGDSERARGRGLEVEERERGGVGREERDGVAGEAEDEVSGAVVVALDLVGEVQLPRGPHGRGARGGGRGLGFFGREAGGEREGFRSWMAWPWRGL